MNKHFSQTIDLIQKSPIDHQTDSSFLLRQDFQADSNSSGNDNQVITKKAIKISNLHCPNCAKELEEEISKIDGVKKVSVNFVSQKVYVECIISALKKVIHCINHFEDVKVVDEKKEAEFDGEKIKIKGLCCANCARELEEELNKISGVKSRVDFMKMNVVLSVESESARKEAIYTITHFEDVKIVEEEEELPSKESIFTIYKNEIISIIISIFFYISGFIVEFLDKNLTVLTYVLFSVAYISVGYKVLLNTIKNILSGRIFDENFLMSLASLCAIFLGVFAGSGFSEGVAVMLLYQIGELLQSIAVGSSRNSISSLMKLKSHDATLIENGEQRIVSSEELKVGDIIIIKVGEKVPIDCKIIHGNSSLDMKSLNGEPLPYEVKEGDEILYGCINISHVIKAEVVREYKNSAVAKILELVEKSSMKKSKPEKFITKFAHYYTPTVCAASVIVAIFVPCLICFINRSYEWPIFRDWIYKSLNFLVISCPCALVISVPLSYFGGIGRCAQCGILVKGSTCLDELAQATIAAFDKTGTLSEGCFKVISYSDEETLSLAAAAEKFSTHPIADAFTHIKTDIEVEEAEEITGKGIKCLYNGKTLLCGNSKLMIEHNIVFKEKKSISTLVYLALDGQYKGVIEIDDQIKSGVKDTIYELKKEGISRTIMLTGDLPERAQIIADEIGIDECAAGLLPDQKLNKAIDIKSHGKLIYVGDGINDAPVMTAADCAISMGKVGSDVAIEASDIVLVSDDISLLPKGRKIARCTRSIVMQNIAGSLIVKISIMMLSITVPDFPLIVSVVADVGVMLIAVLNSMRTALL